MQWNTSKLCKIHTQISSRSLPLALLLPPPMTITSVNKPKPSSNRRKPKMAIVRPSLRSQLHLASKLMFAMQHQSNSVRSLSTTGNSTTLSKQRRSVWKTSSLSSSQRMTRSMWGKTSSQRCLNVIFSQSSNSTPDASPPFQGLTSQWNGSR